MPLPRKPRGKTGKIWQLFLWQTVGASEDETCFFFRFGLLTLLETNIAIKKNTMYSEFSIVIYQQAIGNVRKLPDRERESAREYMFLHSNYIYI
jgi:hypothetical protein